MCFDCISVKTSSLTEVWCCLECKHFAEALIAFCLFHRQKFPSVYTKLQWSPQKHLKQGCGSLSLVLICIWPVYVYFCSFLVSFWLLIPKNIFKLKHGCGSLTALLSSVANTICIFQKVSQTNFFFTIFDYHLEIFWTQVFYPVFKSSFEIV